jgi:hypothetical protein
MENGKEKMEKRSRENPQITQNSLANHQRKNSQIHRKAEPQMNKAERGKTCAARWEEKAPPAGW